MKIKVYAALIFCLLIYPEIFSQNSNTAVNQLNTNGNKEGLWIESDGLVEAYYKNGLRDGIFKAYYKKNGKLAGLGEYTNDTISGTWYYFDENSRLVLVQSEIRKNKHTYKIKDVGDYTPGFVSYAKIYYENGIIQMEGTALYDDDIEIDYWKTGLWKYYDEQGKLIEQREEECAPGE